MNGQIKLDELITRTYTLDEINAAFEDMTSGNVARGVITF
jgi:S-(hydroxymethyl)glutathione dehydrogenase/alcohol dehydrogenase